MNHTLSKLLHSNHQLICPQEGFEAIDMEEWMMILDMDNERLPSVGDWVTVRRGLYKGDVGYVWSLENGQVHLLLVPLLPPLLGLVLHQGKGNGLAPAPNPTCLPKRFCSTSLRTTVSQNSRKRLTNRGGLSWVTCSSSHLNSEHFIFIQYCLPPSPCQALHSMSFKWLLTQIL
jgi:hypothetical protein